MRFKCPECESVLSLGQPKPGNYRPKCKHCGKPFRLKVTEDQPPKIAIGRIRPEPKRSERTPPAAKPQTTAAKPGASPKKPPAQLEATVDPSTAMEATMESSGATQVDATVDRAHVEATQDAAHVDVTQADAARNASGVEATMDAAHVDATQPDITSDGGGVEATMEPSASSTSASTKASRTVVRHGDATHGGGADKTAAAHVDATMQGTIDRGASSATKQSSVSRGRKSSKAIVSAGGAAGKSSSRKVSTKSDNDEIPERLGGYRILRLLGRGAMGAVYEAKQVSLDRLVALKTIRGRLAGNPASLARFTREAYAAAQLTHHNVVQIYDFGEDAGRHFFSMEWVRGGPLDELIHEKGALDPRMAAGYILQAARGLQFAHRNGMVHRDIKPANLLLSDEGVVKVADLGLVKIPDQSDPESDAGASSISGLQSGTQVTMQGTAVGTPAYMAPEQGIDAAAVDHRADIYSLGCTLFYLLAGRPPFDGSVVSEVLEQHASQPLPSLVEINARVPQSLEQIVQRTMAKRPEDRYLSLGEMISDLEAFLGVNADGKFSPTSQQADQWEVIASRHAAAAPLLRLSKPALAGLVAVSALLTLLMPLAAGLGWLLFGPALFLAAIVTALLLGASAGGRPVVTALRTWIGSLSWMDYAIGLIGAMVFLLVAFIAGMWPGLIVGGLLGAIAGAAYHFGLIAPSQAKRKDVILDAERFIRDLRIDGADEEGVRMFAARYAGKQWQDIFEALFGYDSLCKIREQLQGDPSFSASTSSNSWRDKLCASFAAKAKANREAQDLKRLAKIEERGLESEGLSAGDARDRAWQMAAAVMDNAKAVTPAVAGHADADADAAAAAAEEKRRRMKAMLADARSGKYKKKRDKLAPLRFALGGQTRLLAGCVLLAIFAIWGNKHGLFESLKSIDIQQLGAGNLDEMGSALRGAAASAGAAGADTATIGGASPWSVGLAGLLLVMSAFVSGWRMTPFALIATIAILYGPSLGVPGFGPIKPWMVSGLVGIAIYFPGIMFGEKKEF